MNDYRELIELLAHPADGRDNADIMISAADAIEQLIKERDAAVASIKQCWLCASCKKRIRGNEWARCKHFEAETVVVKGDKSYTCKNWEWRGVQE